MDNWQSTKLGEIVKLEYGKSIRDYKHENGEYPVFGTNGQIGTYDEYLCPHAGIIVGRKGAYREVHYSDKPFNVIDTAFYVSPLINDLDLKFLYYFLKGKDINSLNTGSAIPSTSRDDVHNIEIDLPSLPKQRTIAEVLSSLDEKIDLLHRQNKTLEQLAQTLFRQWFVEEAEDDWEEKPLDEVADFLNGIAWKKYEAQEGEESLPVIKIREMRQGFTDASDRTSLEVPEKYIVQNGEVLFSWSGSLVLMFWEYETGVLNQHLYKVTSEDYPKWFYYFWINEFIQKFKMIAESKATTMGHIKRSDLSNSMVVIPPADKLNEMGSKIWPLMDKIINNNKQVKTLEKQRDTLLPKLISGICKVVIKDRINHVTF